MSGSITLYSIGHSDHNFEVFITLLQRYGVTAVADVRSQPYSRWTPQYNRETLARALGAAGINYIFLGAELGGRPADRSLYQPGRKQPDYQRVAATPDFHAGLERLLELGQSSSVAMMCSEGDYRKCHRTLLVTPELLARQVRVVHVLPDGRTVKAELEPQQLSLF